MYRGTTPTIILNVKNEDFDLSLVSACHVTMKSESGYVKEIFDNIIIDDENHRLMFTMSQEDTLQFFAGKVMIQIRVKLNNDAVIASNIVVTDMNELLEDDLM